MMHGVENIFMHGMDCQRFGLSEFGQNINEFGEANAELFNFDKHDHGKVVGEYALRNVDNVCVVLDAKSRNVGNDANHILTGDRNNCFHSVEFLSFWE